MWYLVSFRLYRENQPPNLTTCGHGYFYFRYIRGTRSKNLPAYIGFICIYTYGNVWYITSNDLLWTTVARYQLNKMQIQHKKYSLRRKNWSDNSLSRSIQGKHSRLAALLCIQSDIMRINSWQESTLDFCVVFSISVYSWLNLEILFIGYNRRDWIRQR